TQHRPVHRRARRRHAVQPEHRGRRVAARQPGAAEALALPRRARRTRLRHSRRRQGGRGARTGPPADVAAGAVGTAPLGRRRRERDPRLRADAAGRGRRSERVTRSAAPRLHAYAALAAAGLLGGLALERPEAAVLAGPFALVLALGLATARAPRVRTWVEIERDRVLQGDTISVEITLESEDPVGRLDVLLVLPTGLELAEGENPITISLGYDGERTVELAL